MFDRDSHKNIVMLFIVRSGSVLVSLVTHDLSLTVEDLDRNTSKIYPMFPSLFSQQKM